MRSPLRSIVSLSFLTIASLLSASVPKSTDHEYMKILSAQIDYRCNYYGMNQFLTSIGDPKESFINLIGEVEKIQIDSSVKNFLAISVYGSRYKTCSFFVLYSKAVQKIVFQDAVPEPPTDKASEIKNSDQGTYGGSSVHVLLSNDQLLVWEPFFEDAIVVSLDQLVKGSLPTSPVVSKSISIKTLKCPYSILPGPKGGDEMTILKDGRMLLPAGGGFYSFVDPDPGKIWH